LICQNLTDEEYDKTHAVIKARTEKNEATILACADGAFKRWQQKLRDAKVEYVPYDSKAPPPARPWVVHLGASARSRSTLLSVGGGVVVGDVNGAEWRLDGYLGALTCSTPVSLYADSPKDLWPGNSINNYRDCALLIAAGLCFTVCPSCMPRPEKYSIGSEFNGGEHWARFIDFPSVYMYALDDKELIAGVMAVTDRMMGHIRRTYEVVVKDLAEQHKTISQRLHAYSTIVGSVPVLGTDLV
jgi:hypothetical protein